MWGDVRKNSFSLYTAYKQEAVRFQKREKLRLDAGDNFSCNDVLKTDPRVSISECVYVCVP